MTQYERELSNLSYTNKDFGTIYPELLDLTKKISYKWDPTVSDESDPGVVLLKLAALMADKNNYNIDKNILELFPLSVTQDANARQIFDQCGYCMKYYQSAETTVSLTMISEPEITEDDLSKLSPSNVDIDLEDSSNVRTYKLPIFTMVSDVDNNVVYTLVEESSIKSDGITIDVKAIQGIANNYSINGETLITAANLDYNNRLYFTETDIAENGIFIHNEDKSNYESWKKVDNLVLQSTNTLCYKFGLTPDGSSCYIEFPSDIDNIIGNGIYITYIRTSGKDGNVGKKRLHQFYVDTTATRYIANDTSHVQDVLVSADNIDIINVQAAVSGKNPETIDEAYRNYQKIKGTFETLVSLKDYSNFLYTNKNVSNCYVCDRTNDVQSSYKVLESDNNYTKTHTIVSTITSEDGTISSPELTAFDLRVYGLEYVDDPTNATGYSKSFNLIDMNNTSVNNPAYWIENDTDEIKSIQHDFGLEDKNNPPFKSERILMIKNKYPIVAKIIPQYKVLDLEKTDILGKIKTALYTVLNSRVIDFGAEADYNIIYDAISGADPRIKGVMLEDITYQTFALYHDGETIKEIRIDRDSVKPTDEKTATLWSKFRYEIYAKSVLAGTTQFLDSQNQFTYSLSQQNSTLNSPIETLTTNTKIVVNNFEQLESGEFTAVSPVLSTNENIVLTAPNLITDQTYSTYVKFVHNIGDPTRLNPTLGNTAVAKNAEYTLAENEFIIFFWKADDDEDTPYTYMKYSGESDIKIICPSFTMKVQPDPDNKLLPALPMSLLSQLKDGKGTTDSCLTSVTGEILDSTGTSYHSVTMSLKEYISSLMGSNYVLSGTNSIVTKKPHTIHINNSSNGTNNVYWVLNNSTSDNKYVLFDECSDDDSLPQSYILKSGEYFIYSNASKTQLVMLGSGTKIFRDAVGPAWSVDAIDKDEFISQGIDYFDSETSWFTVPSTTNVYATEMQFYQLGPGNHLRLVTNNKMDPGEVVFSNQEISLANFSISYIDEQGDENYLASRTVESTAWSAYSILNIDTSPTKYQELTSNQFISFDIETDEGVSNVVLTETRFLTDREATITGGVNVDVTTLDTDGKVKPLSIYSFKVSDNDDVFTFDGFDCAVTVKSITAMHPTIYEIKFDIPAGDYIIPINNTHNFYSLNISCDCLQFDSSGKTVYYETTKLVDMQDGNDYTSSGNHYLKLNIPELVFTAVSSEQLLQIEIVFETIGEENSILIGSLYKYNTGFTDDEFLFLSQLIRELDTKKVFNYTYVVPQSQLIKDPLQSKSFLYSNHIYNPFTICQWDNSLTSDSEANITVTDKIK